jgi:urease accessory protein
MRATRPFVFTNLKTQQGLNTVIDFIETEGLLNLESQHER